MATDAAGPAVSETLELAWGTARFSRGGRRPGLSISQIVASAIALADEAGLAACSMPRLASSLGVGTMSLYRYIANKDGLLVLMADAATGPVPRDTPTAGWEQTLRYYATEAMGRYARRPWLLDVALRGFQQTPNVLSWLELGLAALEDTGLSDQQQLGTMLLLDSFVNATARLARAGDRGDMGPSEPPRHLMSAERFPALTRLVDTGALRDDGFADYGFRFGVDRILASTRQLIGTVVPPESADTRRRGASAD